MKDFESFYNELTSDEIWFESIKMTHPGKDWPLAAKQIYTGYLAEKYIPEMKEVRKHLNNKLIYQVAKPQRIETNYQHEKKKEDDFSNPLTEEQKKEVDKMLNEYLAELVGGFQRVPRVKNPEVEGAERLPVGTGYKFDEAEAARKLEEHHRKLTEYRYKTIREKYPELSPKEIYQRIKQMK